MLIFAAHIIADYFSICAEPGGQPVLFRIWPVIYEGIKMRILIAPQAGGTRLACFGTQLRGGSMEGPPRCARCLPVRQEALFTHGVCFYALRYGKCHGQADLGRNIDADFERIAVQKVVCPSIKWHHPWPRMAFPP